MNKKISAFVTSLALLASSAAVMPSFSASAAELPSSVDLSTGEETKDYFPEIGNQENFNSCTAWATTYYQFSYEVKRALGIKNKEFAYSPAYTYNQINFGSDQGSNIINAYYLLKNNGALTFDQFGFDRFYRTNPNRTNPDDVFNSLNMRLANYDSSIYLPSDIDESYRTDAEVRKLEDDVITRIKEKLNEGKMVLTSGNFSNRETNGNDSIIYKNNAAGSGHAYNIVGYDDNFKYTVNGVEMVGAFKILNSWGENWGENGFAWVMYDAFHIKSDYDNMNYTKDYWEYDDNIKGYRWVTRNRTRAFSDNQFYTIEVEEKPVKLVSEVELLTNNSYAMVNESSFYDHTYAYYPSRKNDDEEERILFCSYNSNNNLISNKSVFSGSLYRDITDLSPDNYGNNHSYTIRMKNIDPKDTHFIVKAMRIKDDKGNVVSEKINKIDADNFITAYNNGARCESFDYTFDVNIAKGDLNYDGILDQADLAKISEYFNIINYRNSDEEKSNEIKEKFSSFQLELLDANDDDILNTDDYEILSAAINA